MIDYLFLIIKLILLITFSLYLYKDANNRDLNGFVFSCIFFIIGALAAAKILFNFSLIFAFLLLLYFVFRPKSELIYCRRCFKMKIKQNTFCPHCFDIDKQILKDELNKLEIYTNEKASFPD